jgi:hypothetical protein
MPWQEAAPRSCGAISTSLANGRACADCHIPSEGFQLSPSAARARFDALMEKQAQDEHADDSLFRPVDADDFRITLPLPASVKLIDPATGQPSDETFVDLWRAVMPCPTWRSPALMR